MSRYIVVPENIIVRDPVTGDPTKKPNTNEVWSCSFAQSCRIILAELAQGGQNDVLEIFDIRRATDAAIPGKVLKLSDAWWELLEKRFRKPLAAHPFWISSSEPHVRALTAAIDKKPADYDEAADA